VCRCKNGCLNVSCLYSKLSQKTDTAQTYCGYHWLIIPTSCFKATAKAYQSIVIRLITWDVGFWVCTVTLYVPIWVTIFLIHPPALSGNYQQKHVSEAGKTWREMAENFVDEVALIVHVAFFNMTKNLTTWNRLLLLSLRRKAPCGFLTSLKIHRPRPGSKPWTLGPMASALTTSPQKVTYEYVWSCRSTHMNAIKQRTFN
jgi:hypothetical protein